MTFEKVREIIADQFSVDVDKITETTNIAEELGADSLDLVEIVLQAEEEFNITFSDEELNSFKTVNDVCKVLDNK